MPLSTIDAATIVFTRVRQLHALGEVEPCLLAFGDVHQQTGVEQGSCRNRLSRQEWRRRM